MLRQLPAKVSGTAALVVAVSVSGAAVAEIANPLVTCLEAQTSSTEINAWRKRMLRIYDDSPVSEMRRSDQTFRLAVVTLALSRCRSHADQLKTSDSEEIIEVYSQYLDALIRRDRSSSTK